MNNPQISGITTDTRSAEFVVQLTRLNEIFTGNTGDAIMDGLRVENLHRCPGCDFLGICQAQCLERPPLTAGERARIDAYRADAMLSA